MNADPNLNDNEKEAVKEMLRKIGVDVAENNDAPAPPTSIPKDGSTDEEAVMSALDISGHENVETYQLDESAVEGLEPEEKQRIRRVPGSMFGRGKEIKPEAAKEDPWVRRIPELGTVTVTSGEKDIFFKSLMNNERVEFPVAIVVGPDHHFKITCRTLTPLEREIVGLAVNEIALTYPNKNVENALLVSDYYLKIATLAQITRIEGNPDWKAFDLSIPPDTLPEETDVHKKLARRARLAFADANQLRVYIRALHMFETKIIIMEDAMVNRDFWQPADIN